LGWIASFMAQLPGRCKRGARIIGTQPAGDKLRRFLPAIGRGLRRPRQFDRWLSTKAVDNFVDDWQD
jgi:hypothetical protein